MKYNQKASAQGLNPEGTGFVKFTFNYGLRASSSHRAHNQTHDKDEDNRTD